MADTPFSDLPNFDGNYSDEKLAEFSKMVDEKFDEARHKLEDAMERVESTSSAASGDTSHGLHMADQGTDGMEREKAFLFAQRDEKYLLQMNKSKERIKSKIFGICRQCGKKISEKRLYAVPTTNICIDCKSENERAKRR